MAALVGAAPATLGVATPLGAPVAPLATAQAAPVLAPAAPVSWTTTLDWEVRLTGAWLAPPTVTAWTAVLLTSLTAVIPVAVVLPD